MSWDCLVAYRGNRYSVPAVYAGKMVWLRVSQGRRLVILDSKRSLLAEHELCPGRGQLVMRPSITSCSASVAVPVPMPSWPSASWDASPTTPPSSKG